jgi:GlpG protein
MITEPVPPADHPDASPATTAARAKLSAYPWVTSLAVLACIAVFIGLWTAHDPASPESLYRWGYAPATAVWGGAHWALLTSVFVHLALWHLAFNVFWLWVLGIRLERRIGSLQFLAFFLASALVSSSCQLAVSDDTGIGASGVVYALFGFMWLARDRFPEFRQVVDQRIATFFVAALVACLVASYLTAWQVGNAAHISGMAFGCLVAASFVLHYKPRLTLAGLAGLVVLSIIPLFWCPWSVAWLSDKAYRAHEGRRYQEAIDLYTQVLQMDPQNAWAYYNRSSAYEALGDARQAEADLKKARELDPEIKRSQ